MESGALDGGGPALEALPVLGGASVWGTLVASAPGLERLSLADCRTIVPDRGEGTVTRLPAVLLARYRGESTEAARAYFSALWALLRPVLAGVPAVPPRIWQT
jgi:urease accessory protein